jgi:hypothetical protein
MEQSNSKYPNNLSGADNIILEGFFWKKRFVGCKNIAKYPKKEKRTSYILAYALFSYS